MTDNGNHNGNFGKRLTDNKRIAKIAHNELLLSFARITMAVMPVVIIPLLIFFYNGLATPLNKIAEDVVAIKLDQREMKTEIKAVMVRVDGLEKIDRIKRLKDRSVSE